MKEERIFVGRKDELGQFLKVLEDRYGQVVMRMEWRDKL